jgi:hypothetical protein
MLLKMHYNLRMKIYIFTCVAALLLTSCRPLPLYYAQPSGPPEYRLGWEDGCDSGISSKDTFLYKLLYGFRKRPEFGNNELYKTAWNEGYSYCGAGSDKIGNWAPGNDF